MGNFASECIQSRKKLKRTLAYAPTCDQVMKCGTIPWLHDSTPLRS
ncbi:hypothetical protein SO694_0020204 [Aureococcus anophagefferens]|uniref:Uncharacterized protein n=1 Tax=Aureococcus anophagefferens TaxID=44056 RepID=A0ABR1FNP5_AURAN